MSDPQRPLRESHAAHPPRTHETPPGRPEPILPARSEASPFAAEPAALAALEPDAPRAPSAMAIGRPAPRVDDAATGDEPTSEPPRPRFVRSERPDSGDGLPRRRHVTRTAMAPDDERAEPAGEAAIAPPRAAETPVRPAPLARPRPPFGAPPTTHGVPGSVTAIGMRAEAPTERLPSAEARRVMREAPPIGCGAQAVMGERFEEAPAQESFAGAWILRGRELYARLAQEGGMGNGAKIGLVGVLALIVLVVALWDKSNENASGARPLEPFTQAPPDTGQLAVSARAEQPGAASGPATFAARTAPVPPPALPALPTAAPPALPAAPSAPSALNGQSAAEATSVAIVLPPIAPTPAPAGGSGAAPGEQTYTVAPGDTLAAISQRFYGSSRHYMRIAEANKDRIPNPNVVPLGVTLRIPAAPASASAGTATGAPAPVAARAGSAAPALSIPAGARTHVVQRGETLYQIAGRYLGSGTKHDQIYQANKDRIPNPNSLPAGITLVIPPAR